MKIISLTLKTSYFSYFSIANLTNFAVLLYMIYFKPELPEHGGEQAIGLRRRGEGGGGRHEGPPSHVELDDLGVHGIIRSPKREVTERPNEVAK